MSRYIAIYWFCYRKADNLIHGLRNKPRLDSSPVAVQCAHTKRVTASGPGPPAALHLSPFLPVEGPDAITANAATEARIAVLEIGLDGTCSGTHAQ
jgi:hypothetical protein